MKQALWAMVVLPFAAAVFGQVPVKSQAAQKTPTPLITDQEKNVRAYIELLRSDIKDNRAQIMGLVMQLDAGDSAKFWPVYKEFETEYTEFGNGVIALIRTYVAKYDEMTPEIADQLATKLLDLEQQRNVLKRKYYQKFKEALDPISKQDSFRWRTKSNESSTCRSLRNFRLSTRARGANNEIPLAVCLDRYRHRERDASRRFRRITQWHENRRYSGRRELPPDRLPDLPGQVNPAAHRPGCVAYLPSSSAKATPPARRRRLLFRPALCCASGRSTRLTSTTEDSRRG